MQKEVLGIEHKPLLYDRLRSVTTPVAEYSFANLYLFRKAHAYEVVIDKDVFIAGTSYDGLSYCMPTRDIRDIDIESLISFMKNYNFLFPIPEEWLSGFDLSLFDVSYRDGDTDYIYTVEKMRTYSGKKLHGKRNLLHQFESGYEHRAVPLTTAQMDDARHILREWQNETGLGAEETDFGPCMEALDMYDDLILCGGIYYADNEPAGFVIGEELNDRTFALHFAKGRTKFKGIYQYIFNNFAGILPPRYTHLNFEQDLDKENLRLSKTSYVPDMLLKKLRLSVR